MAQPKRQADFFCTAEGVVTRKARPLHAAERRRIFLRDKGICQRCGVKTVFGGNTASPFTDQIPGHIDHIIPRARGGQNDDANLRLLCITCNSRKGAK